MRTKYIIANIDGLPTPFIFPETFIHADLAKGVGRRPILGAGFVSLLDGKLTCYGESISLNVKSRGDIDSKILNSMLFL
jgi:hypothetical protein